MTALFDTLGLKANKTKTKVMVFRGPVAPTSMSTDAYNPKCIREGKTIEEKRKEKVNCSICKKKLKRESLQQHMLQQHSTKP